MRVGWLLDACTYIGGAERTQQEFRDAAPEGVEVVDCPAGGVVAGLDRYVVHNCVTYSRDELTTVDGGWKYWHDVGPYLSGPVWSFLTQYTHPIFVSPLQMEYMTRNGRFDNDSVGHPFYGSNRHLIPPAVPLDPFREAAENAGERSGAVAVARNWWLDKGASAAREWAEGNGGIDFYGEGVEDSELVDYDELPEVLARYKTFVHLPRVIDPCPRTPIEAHAAGCEIVVNRLVGSRYWIEQEPEKLESAAGDFWNLVMGTEKGN